MELQHEQGTAKSGIVLIKSKISALHVAWRVLKILLFLAVSNALGFVFFVIPLIDLIPNVDFHWVTKGVEIFLVSFGTAVFLVSWGLVLFWIVILLMYCFGHTVITTDGIYGRDKYNKPFDLPFDRIQKFERDGTRIIMEADVITKHGDVKRMEYVIPMINSVEFEQAYLNR